MELTFTKLHGTGNDFVLVDARRRQADWPQLAARLCDRHLGIGADGLILVLPSRRADFRMRIFNPDGSEAEMCGNGIRCFAKFVVEELLQERDHPQLTVESMAGVHELRLTARSGRVEQVRVSMGAPELRPDRLPMALPPGPAPVEGPVMDYPVSVAGRPLRLTCLSMGNPHAVHFEEASLAGFPLREVGPQVEHLALFPKRVNFEVVRVRDRAHLEAAVWERGAGPTLACGTGACAAVVAARLHGWVDDAVEVMLPGGALSITWPGRGEVILEGPAVRVFSGTWSG
ncbi:MAG: diaminopimelate epimerase [Chloroflexi bacterium]|nr:diaminopimelate epimerase [Chloroflexota bacterium]